MNRFSFDDEFDVMMDDENFHVYVQGEQVRDEYDFHRWDTEIKTILIFNENEDRISTSHPLYADIVQEVYDQDYEIENYNPSYFEEELE